MDAGRKRMDIIAQWMFRMSAGLCILSLAGIVCMLLWNSILFFRNVSPGHFFFTKEWNPAALDHPTFGLISLLKSTLMVTGIAMLIAVPLGIGTASFIAEYEPGSKTGQQVHARIRGWLKPAIELLAAIPSVVIGFIGIVVVAPAIAAVFGVNNGLNILNGGLLLAIMALPTIITLAEEAIYAVPREYREAAYALGASRWQALTGVILPSCKSGLLAALLLGLGRAFGETMTVLMATGNAQAEPHGIFDAARTITACIAIEMGEVAKNSVHYQGLFALGLVLFALTMFINFIGEQLASRYRKIGQ